MLPDPLPATLPDPLPATLPDPLPATPPAAGEDEAREVAYLTSPSGDFPTAAGDLATDLFPAASFVLISGRVSSWKQEIWREDQGQGEIWWDLVQSCEVWWDLERTC